MILFLCVSVCACAVLSPAKAGGPDLADYIYSRYVDYNGTVDLTVSPKLEDQTGLNYKWTLNSWDDVVQQGSSNTCTAGPVLTNCSYFCTVTNSAGDAEYYEFMLHIRSHLSVTYGEGCYEDMKVPLGTSATLKANISCDVMEGLQITWSLSEREWDEMIGTSWSTTPSSIIEGATSNIYTTPAVQSEQVYTCEARDQFGNWDSITFYVNVDNGLLLEAKQKKVSVKPGETAILEVIAHYNQGPVIFQWQDLKTWTIIEGETSATCAIPNVQRGQRYRCAVMDSYGNCDIEDFQVGIDNGFTVKRNNPDPVRVLEGGSVVLSVTASCDVGELTYYWQDLRRPWDSYFLNNNTDSCLLENVTGSGTYTCNVSDSYGNTETVYFYVEIGENEEDHWLNVNVGQTVILPDSSISGQVTGIVSEDPDIATINPDLSVKATGSGMTTLEITYENGRGTYDFRVWREPVLVLPEDLEILEESAFEGVVYGHVIQLGSKVRIIGTKALDANMMELIVTSPDTRLSRDMFSDKYGYTILCPKGSMAEEYAIENGIDWAYLKTE